ncbi:MAG: leucine-rich repeat protein, partial [Salinivirgaceae bacterium]|nr:leucine-rich repeat protein [Salinivirgaceae bacterium]
MVLNCSSKIVNDCLSVSNVTCIGQEAFRNCKSLTSVSLPQTIKSIGERTFEGCSSLTAISIPDSVIN